METDSLFLKGTGHTVCQDYSTSGSHPGLGIAIVSDGCSMSPQSDVGARLVAETANSGILDLFGSHPYPLSQTLWGWVEPKLRFIQPHLKLPENALDATLVAAVASEKDGTLTLFLWGDGHIIYTTRDGTRTHIGSKFPSGAPYYPSYLLRKNGPENYREAFGDPLPVIIKTTRAPDGTSTEETLAPNPHSRFEVPLADILFVCVCSDGIETFSSPESPDPIPTEEIIGEVTGFKSTAGEFVKRRLLKFQKNCTKRGWSHYDDISCAAIAFPTP